MEDPYLEKVDEQWNTIKEKRALWLNMFVLSGLDIFSQVH